MKRYVKQFPNLNLHGRFLIFDKKKRGVQEKRGGEGEYCNSKGKNEGEGSGVSEQGVHLMLRLLMLMNNVFHFKR